MVAFMSTQTPTSETSKDYYSFCLGRESPTPKDEGAGWLLHPQRESQYVP
jgi:hypothetical protein